MSAPNVRSRAAGPAGGPLTPSTEARELSNYRLGERIAQEELATVYHATHLVLDRPVEVSILRRSDWVSSSRFQLAGRLGARLHHANILPVIDAGHDERYGDYMVTARLDGRTLADVLAGGPLDALLALRVFSQLGSALDYLHKQGIFHRDIRPANIILTPQGIAYLANFSLAASPETPDLSSIDESDYLTPYSAPEQSLRAGAPTAALDLYSMGAVLYQMLSAEPPPAPGQLIPSLAERDSALTGADRVIRRLLSIDPTQRFSSAEQGVTALRQSLRKQIDDSTEDMDEARWEPMAEWLENPLETVVGDLIDHEFTSKSRARADTLHRAGAIRRTLDRWSRQGLLRRPALGQLVQPEQIVSYNLYFYDLRAYYETRTPPDVREQTARGIAINPFANEPDLWDVPVPEIEPFVVVPAETVIVPGSQKVVPCSACNGATQVTCKSCGGKGLLERTRRISGSDGKTEDETLQEKCPNCHGYGKQPCQTCEATGQMLQEKVFRWSRQGKIHSNEDDIVGLPKQALAAQAQTVYQSRIDPYEARWYQIAPLQELLDTAIKDGGANTRLITAELIIRGVPVTEVDYRYRDKQRTLAFLGTKDELHGDLVLYDTERIVLYTAIAVLIVTLAVVLIFFR